MVATTFCLLALLGGLDPGAWSAGVDLVLVVDEVLRFGHLHLHLLHLRV